MVRILATLLRADSGAIRADHISRLRTSGGVAPAESCTAGQTVAVPYQSIHVLRDAPAA